MSEMQVLIVVMLGLMVSAIGGLAYVVEVKEVNNYDRQAYVGLNVELECGLRNRPGLSWRKLVGRMSDESEELSNGNLAIYQVTKEDAGEYECVDGESGESRRMRLVVLQGNRQFDDDNDDESDDNEARSSRHFQSKYKKEIEADLGSSVEIFCEFKDEPDVEWRKTRGTIGPHKTIYGAPDNRLALHYLNEEDEGIYECVLPDGTKSSIELKIRAKKSGVNDDEFKTNSDDYSNDYQLENVQTIQTEPGKDVELVCTLNDFTRGADGINWRKVAGIISENSQIVENRLNLYSVSAADSGIYECSSENLNSMKFHLIVNEERSTSPQPSQDTTTKSWWDDDWSADDSRTTTTAAPDYYPYTPEPEIDDPVDSIVTKSVGNSVELICDLRVASSDSISWRKLDGEIDFDRSTRFSNKLVLNNVKFSDAGVYQCESSATRNVHRTRLSVMAQAFPRDPNTTVLQTDYQRYDNRYPAYCRPEEATCRNGQCIPKSVLCNGHSDCLDGSDENNCGVSNAGYIGKCQPNEKPCRSDGKCIPKIWFCDGERECADGSDEESCTGPSPGGMCRPFEFMCKNRQQCIYKSFLCDAERDCGDSSDETGCVEPKVTQPPIRQLTVCLGATFKLDCRAIGFPVPFINWRLNWGHVCPEPRCWMVTDETGFGVLTVTDARWEDAGAYSCEAISTKGREFAIPDAIVRIEQCSTTTTSTRPTTPPAPIFDDCYCHEHSDTCTCSNICYDCQHNTTGPKCEFCAEGYFRDPSRPNDPTAWCFKDNVPPPIQITTTTRRTTTTTYIVDEEDCVQLCHNHSECTCNMQCYSCQDNTMGDRCQYCRPGYTGDATRGTPNDCVPIDGFNTGHYHDRFQAYLDATTRSQSVTSGGECNQFGTAQTIDGVCKCKAGVIGASCDQCAPNFFHLVEQKTHKKGCLSCFCNGLEVSCDSSQLSYSKLVAKFEGDDEEWKISDRFIDTKLDLERVDAGVEFSRFSEFKDVEMYFLVPLKFKGNKLGAYGGNLEFKLTVKDGSESSQDGELKPVEIRISGSRVNIVHKSETPIQLNQETTISVNLVEENFKRYGDNGKVDRDHLMMALSDIRIIMIRASYTANQESIRLSDFSLDVASEDGGQDEENQVEAKAVEVCQCPPGYTGNSCENCAEGYERSTSGFYLGLCKPI